MVKTSTVQLLLFLPRQACPSDGRRVCRLTVSYPQTGKIGSIICRRDALEVPPLSALDGSDPVVSPAEMGYRF